MYPRNTTVSTSPFVFPVHLVVCNHEVLWRFHQQRRRIEGEETGFEGEGVGIEGKHSIVIPIFHTKSKHAIIYPHSHEINQSLLI